jgi:hypothetical protein
MLLAHLIKTSKVFIVVNFMYQVLSMGCKKVIDEECYAPLTGAI